MYIIRSFPHLLHFFLISHILKLSYSLLQVVASEIDGLVFKVKSILQKRHLNLRRKIFLSSMYRVMMLSFYSKAEKKG